ncbi:MAG: tetratricopeptide repeat protein [Planctomycetaceae bacterium]
MKFLTDRSAILTMTMTLVLCSAYVRVSVAWQSQPNELSQFDQLMIRAEYTAAEKLASERKVYYEQNNPDKGSLFRWNWRLGLARLEMGKYREAEPVLKLALSQAESLWPKGHIYTSEQMLTLADLYTELNRFDEAEKLYQEALARRRKGLTVDPTEQAEQLRNAADVLESQGMSKLAEDVRKLAENAINDKSKQTQVNTADVADALDRLAKLYTEQGRYKQAEPLFKESLELRESVWGPLQRDVAISVDNLGNLHFRQGRYTTAESRYKQALAIREKLFGPNSREAAQSLTQLGRFYVTLGRFADAESLLNRSFAICQSSKMKSHPEAAACRYELARLYDRRGEYAQADLLYRSALEIRQATYSSLHKSLAESYNAAGELYRRHGRYDEAETLLKQALRVREDIFGLNHVALAESIESLAELYFESGRDDDAIAYYQRALEILTAAVGNEHPDVAAVKVAMARIHLRHQRLEEAESLLDQAQATQQAALGEQHTDLAVTLAVRAEGLLQNARPEDARPLIERAIAIADQSGTRPEIRAEFYGISARAAWITGERQSAVDLLEKAIALAEQQRLQAYGSEYERGALFGRSSSLFDLMVSWQMELGDINAALGAAERSRARTLIDQMEQHGFDPLASVPAEQRERLRKLYAARQMRAASLARELALLNSSTAAPAERQRQASDLQAKLSEAQGKIADAYRDIQTAATASGTVTPDKFQPVDLTTLSQWLKEQEAILLYYIATDQGVFRLSISKDGETSFQPVQIDEALAQRLGIAAGPLSVTDLRRALMIEDRDVAAWLARPDGFERVQARLADLWLMIVPEPLREALRSQQAKRLYFVPDGALVGLPIEALVTETDPSPQLLIDDGPPICYVPSVTVLYELAHRGGPQPKPITDVLTVGNAVYSKKDPSNPSAIAGGGELASRTRYHYAGGSLTDLPFSQQESTWVQGVLKEQGIATRSLSRQQATEANVRRDVKGATLIHLACHGLVDQRYGNLFGALALTSGEQNPVNPADDGFLTLGEIYELDLSDCELSVLSACQTNYGPQQAGEGVWAISRGFLVAGSRRVVASNWLVDDEAAASLISYYVGGLANSKKRNAPADYAESLHAAKKWIRAQDKWSNPYFWATFVLIGPP